MALIEIDSLPFLIAWWIFPWLALLVITRGYPFFFMTSRDDPPVAAPVSPNGGFWTKLYFQKDHLPYIYGDEQWDFERYIYIHMSHCSSLKDMMNYGNEPLTTKKHGISLFILLQIHSPK